MSRGGDPLGQDPAEEEEAAREFAWAGVTGGGSGMGPPGSLTWPLGAVAARLLRRVCADRLLPTTWLNKVGREGGSR
jgi:hypothetical protein